MEFTHHVRDIAPWAKYCCHLRTATFPYEVTVISAYLDTELSPRLVGELRKRVEEKVALIANMSEAQRFAANIKCAFLLVGRLPFSEPDPM